MCFIACPYQYPFSVCGVQKAQKEAISLATFSKRNRKPLIEASQEAKSRGQVKRPPIPCCGADDATRNVTIL